MISHTLFKDGGHSWFVFGQDPEKPDQVIDTNQYVVVSGNVAILLDPGGTEIFPAMLAALSEKVSMDQVRHLFMSHQDPDIGSSLPLWRQVCPDGMKIYLSWLWKGFVSHFDSEAAFTTIPDEGMEIHLSHDTALRLIPAHYLHSAGNFHVYDPAARILFTGDVGAAMVPQDARTGFFVEDFAGHVQYMEGFHRRWMCSGRARDAWVALVSDLEIDFMAPQHGLIFRGDDVNRFIDWFADLELGTGCDPMMEAAGIRSQPVLAAPGADEAADETADEA